MKNVVSSARSPVLPMALRRPLAVVAVLSALTVGTLGFVYAGHSQPGLFDRWVPPTLVNVDSLPADLADLLASSGEPEGAIPAVVVLVAVCLLVRRPRMAVLAVAGPVLTVGVVTVLKHVFRRTIYGDNLSFPSGHTSFATALAFVFGLLLIERFGLSRRAGLALLFVLTTATGAVMGWVVVALRLHYTTDAFGGFGSALIIVPIAAWLVDRAAVGIFS
ncbi:MAG: phosphatase PAP2 family protein [Sciscionella sp.]